MIYFICFIVAVLISAAIIYRKQLLSFLKVLPKPLVTQVVVGIIVVTAITVMAVSRTKFTGYRSIGGTNNFAVALIVHENDLEYLYLWNYQAHSKEEALGSMIDFIKRERPKAQSKVWQVIEIK